MNRTRLQYLVLAVCACMMLIAAASALASHPAPKDTPGATAAPLAIAAPYATRQLAKTTYVYIADTGTKYHRSSCRFVKKSKHRKTLSWAKSHGYKACKVCNPPTK